MADAQAAERDRIRAAAKKNADEEAAKDKIANKWITELLREAREEAGK